MEPIPLVLLTKTEKLLETAPRRVAGVISEEKQNVPTGQAFICPRRNEDEVFSTESYIAQCREAFQNAAGKSDGFCYLCGALDFRSLRAAVLALTDLCERTIIAELIIGSEGLMADGTDCVAAVGVLQRIGVSTVFLRAQCAEDLTAATERLAPYARLSVGASVPCAWIENDIELTNVEIFLPQPGEDGEALLHALDCWQGHVTETRDHDDVLLAPDGQNAHFIDPTIDISDEIECDHRFSERLLDAEDEEAAAFKLLIEEEEGVGRLEEFSYMISRPVCLCAEHPELLERALRVFPGLALYDGTWQQDEAQLKYFEKKYGLIRL